VRSHTEGAGGAGATPAGTAAYRDAHPALAARGHFRASTTGLVMSSVGLGTYLGEEDDASDRLYGEAVARALELGCNVVDSAINYRCQRSERIVGRTLGTLIRRGVVRRDQVVVATKVGFLPFDGHVPPNPEAYLQRTYVDSGIIDPRDLVAGCHCIGPAFLHDQLGRSLANLDLPSIDIYYLHNPETQLQEVARGEFQARMKAAFAFLEAQADAGRIRAYGIATWNGLRRTRRAPDYLALADLVRLAEELRGPHHRFRFVQLPFNLAMAEARTVIDQPLDGKRLSVLGAARHLNLTVVASASILQGELARLPEALAAALPGLGSDTQRAIQFVRSTLGITTALVGMRGRRHVEDNLSVARVSPDPDAAEGLVTRAA
jgi:aryl-alcohol dehydrogenase-like predicted oxidoreductase